MAERNVDPAIVAGLKALAERLAASDRGWMSNAQAMIALYEEGWRYVEPGGVLLTAAEAAALGRVLDSPAILESGRRYCFVGHADAGALRAALARATGGG